MAVLRAVFLGLVGAVVALARDPTYSDWLEVEVLIQQAIDASTCDEEHPAWDPNLKKEHNNQLGECTPTGTSFPTKRNPKPLGSRLLRLAFHDAAGRMDAYVNMSLEENAGLDVATNILDNKYNSFNLQSGEAIKDVLDKADFYAWSYIAAVRYLAFLQTKKGGAAEVIYPVIPITWGRVAYNPGDAVPDEAFPPKGGHSTHSEILDYFSQDFGYSTSEVVTLLGAHTLGGARLDTTDFTGMWTQSKNILDEAYYSNMKDPTPLASCEQGVCTELPRSQCTATKRCRGWQQVQMGAQAGFQWRHSCGETPGGEVDKESCTHLMLNSDISLLYDIDNFVHATTGEITGYPQYTPGKCSQAKFNQGFKFIECFSKRQDSASDLVEDFAASLEAWLEAFGPIFDKLIQRPYTDLAVLVAPTTTADICGSGEIADADPCPAACADELVNQGDYNTCPDCASCYCYKAAGPTPKCRNENFIANLR